MPNMTCVKEDILCPFLEINTKSTDHREILPITIFYSTFDKVDIFSKFQFSYTTTRCLLGWPPMHCLTTKEKIAVNIADKKNQHENGKNGATLISY